MISILSTLQHDLEFCCHFFGGQKQTGRDAQICHASQILLIILISNLPKPIDAAYPCGFPMKLTLESVDRNVSKVLFSICLLLTFMTQLLYIFIYSRDYGAVTVAQTVTDIWYYYCMFKHIDSTSTQYIYCTALQVHI